MYVCVFLAAEYTLVNSRVSCHCRLMDTMLEITRFISPRVSVQLVFLAVFFMHHNYWPVKSAARSKDLPDCRGTAFWFSYVFSILCACGNSYYDWSLL
jgi:hypothetical protein